MITHSEYEPLFCIGEGEVRSVSPENPTGEKGRGGMARPGIDNIGLPTVEGTNHLGRGWKNAPFLSVAPGETVTLMDVSGSGIIDHIWMLAGNNLFDAAFNADDYILRFYWDGCETPAVEAPVSLFFATGSKLAHVNSAAVMVDGVNALNSYWKMPFLTHARITYTNASETKLNIFTYQITYTKRTLPQNVLEFHAARRHANTADENPYLLLDTKGEGKYVGTVLRVKQLADGWFGEGEFKFYIDGDGEFPSICGTGMEDYFLSSFGLQEGCNLYSGVPKIDFAPLVPEEHDMKLDGTDEGFIKNTVSLMYRFHTPDPILYHENLKVTVQALGPIKVSGTLEKRADEYDSLALYYERPDCSR